VGAQRFPGRLGSAPAVVATGTRRWWWQWLLLAHAADLLLALLAWLVRPYLPHIEPYLEAEARDRALSLAVRQRSSCSRRAFAASLAPG